jgi:valyl-tRNA synthetase
MLLCSPAGNDLLFDESLTEQGRNFGNKIWNAFRLVKSWTLDENLAQPEESAIAAVWFENKLNEAILQLDDQFSNYRLSDALMTVYKLFWDEFSSWYLEAVKPAYQKPVDKVTLEQANGFLEKLSALLHPFMPFITEEVWQLIRERGDDESLMVSGMPEAGRVNQDLAARFELAKQVITSVRNIRNEKNLSPKERLELHYMVSEGEYDSEFDVIIKKLANLEGILNTAEKPDDAVSFIVKNTEYYIPMEGRLNIAEEIEKLNRELEYTRGFLNSVLKKLSNERFVKNAPDDVVEKENAKKTDAENKIAALEKQLAGLMG